MAVNETPPATDRPRLRLWPAIAFVAVGFLLGWASMALWRWASEDPAHLVEDARLRLEDPLDTTRRAYANWVVSERPIELLAGEQPNRGDHDTRRRTLLAYLKSPLVLTAALRDPSVSDVELLRDEQDPVGWLNRRLVAYYPADGELLTLALPHPSAAEHELVAVVNAIAQAFQGEVLFRLRSDQRLPLQLLKSQLGKVQSSIASFQARLAETVAGDSTASTEVPAERRKLDVLLDFERELLLRVERLQLESLQPSRVQPIDPGPNGAARATFDSGVETLPWLD